MQKISNTLDSFFALDELANRHSPVHALHPMAKLVVTLVFIVCVISSGRYDAAGLTIYFFYPALLIALGELPLGAIAKRAFPALPFVLFAGLSNILFERALAPAGVSYGVLSCAVLLEKALLTVSAVVILAATTPANALLGQMQRLRLPRIFTTTVMLCFRYLALLASEARNMTRAYHLRAVKQNGLEMEHLGAFIGQLLLRSIDRAERVYRAMQCRGFDGTFPETGREKADKKSRLFAIGISALLIFIRAVGVSTLLESLGRLFL
ncbi:MAG: cobalt ECF transporter T component CbiQ [Christensenella sp.]|nr:cobalt ECF transporter T component CbiQ [Christensenella sp.]